MLRVFAIRVLWNEYLPDIPGSFVEPLQICSGEKAIYLKIFALVPYPVHSMMLIFCKVYKMWLIRRGQGLVELLPVITEKSEGMRNADIKRCTE